MATVAALLLPVGCGLPDYRVYVDKIPADATELWVVAHIYPETMTVYHQPPVVQVNPIPLKEGRENVSVAFKLDGALAGQPAVFSVAAAKDACIVASGATDMTARMSGDVVRDVPLHLQAVSPLAVPGSCTEKNAPVILAVERLSRGAWGAEEHKLNIYGWNWTQAYQPEVRSTGYFRCFPDATSVKPGQASVCKDLDCTGTCPAADFIGAPECRTNCLMTTTVDRQLGSSLSTVTLTLPASIDKTNASSLLAAAMVIKLQSSFTSLGTYSEKPPSTTP